MVRNGLSRMLNNDNEFAELFTLIKSFGGWFTTRDIHDKYEVSKDRLNKLMRALVDNSVVIVVSKDYKGVNTYCLTGFGESIILNTNGRWGVDKTLRHMYVR